MFGKSIFKVIGLIFAGAIALAGGAQLLASVVGVVLAFKAGNPLPLLLIFLLAIVIQRIAKKQTDDTPVKMILNIATYAATGYLVVVSFVIALPLGLVASIAIAIAMSVIISFIGDPSSLSAQLQVYIPSFGKSMNGLSKRVVQINDGTPFTVNSTSSIVVINSEHRSKVVELMRDRSLLPISLTHYEDLDVLFVSTGKDNAMYNRVCSLLSMYGIETKGPTPNLLTEAVQLIPIIDEQNGLKMREYRLVRDERIVQELLALWPVRMTVFPSEHGLMILVPEIEVTGLNVEPLKQGYESQVLLHRNYSIIREEREPIENTA